MLKGKLSPLLLVTACLVLGSLVLSRTSPTAPKAYADENSPQGSEVTKEKETDKAEPTDTPEPKDKETEQKTQEQEVEKVHREIQSQVDQNEVKNIEVAPATGSSGQATSVDVQNQQGQTTKQIIPSGNTPVFTLQTAASGSVAVSVTGSGVATINNNGILVQTQYPIVIDPVNKTIAIRTPAGLTVINTLPSQALNNLPPQAKPNIINSTNLELDNGTPVYKAAGVQKRFLFGLIPVEGSVVTTISTQNGAVINSQLPWFFKSLGFLFTT